MRDFNFFEPYLTKPNKLSKKQITSYAVISVIFIALVTMPIVNQFNIKKMQEETIAVSAIVDSSEAIEERQKISDKQSQIQELEEYRNKLELIHSEIIKVDLINDLFLQAITDRVPEAVFFQNININRNSIQLTGVSKSNGSIAEFEQNLRGFEYFENVFISNISASTVGYTFSISFQIKGGVDDEAN